MRRFASTVTALALLGLTAGLLSGCSPSEVGIVGVGVDERGDLVGYLQVCQEGSLDDALLYVPDGPTLGRWQARPPITDFASWSLARPGDWIAVQAYRPPRSNEELVLTAGSSDGESRAYSVNFTLSELRGLSPGQVLFGDEANGFQTVSERDFGSEACEWL